MPEIAETGKQDGGDQRQSLHRDVHLGDGPSLVEVQDLVEEGSLRVARALQVLVLVDQILDDREPFRRRGCPGDGHPAREGLTGEAGRRADREQLVPEAVQVLDELLGVALLGVHDDPLELGHLVGDVGDEVLEAQDDRRDERGAELGGRLRLQLPRLQPPEGVLGLPKGRLGRHVGPRPSVDGYQVPLAHELVERQHVTLHVLVELDVVQDEEHVVGVGVDLRDVALLRAVLDRVRVEVEHVLEVASRLLVECRDVEPQEPVAPFQELGDLGQVAWLDPGGRDPSSVHAGLPFGSLRLRAGPMVTRGTGAVHRQIGGGARRVGAPG